jgi:ABC-type polysaccharide/polyol phosphate transport system ATPase subunit
MSGDIVLAARGVSKKFARDTRRALSYGVRDILGELLFFSRTVSTLRPGEFWALREVDFELRRGEALAVVGHNGAGKSTLLRILYGLIKPDSGEVVTSGPIEGIIELGAGMNPLLTGRENMELAATLHGLPAPQRRRFLDEAIDFAGLGPFADTPIQTYSSGMRARLSFAASAHLRPDVLLVDEVLAVGDLAFQRKCLGFIRGFLADGGALIFVSHSPYQIQTLCERGLVLEEGRRVFDGPAVEAVDRLLRTAPEGREEGDGRRSSSGPVAIESLAAEAPDGGPIRAGAPFRVRLGYATTEPLEAVWGFSIWTGDQWVCVAGEHDPAPRRLAPGRGELVCTVDRPPLVGGRYVLRAALLDAATMHPLALYGFDEAPAQLAIEEPPAFAGTAKMALHQIVHLDVRWG